MGPTWRSQANQRELPGRSYRYQLSGIPPVGWEQQYRQASLPCPADGEMPREVVVDLAETALIDTAILRILATGQQLLDRQGRIVTVRSPVETGRPGRGDVRVLQ